MINLYLFSLRQHVSTFIETFVSLLNTKFPTVKFTYEREYKEQLPFLDNLEIKNSNKLELLSSLFTTQDVEYEFAHPAPFEFPSYKRDILKRK